MKIDKNFNETKQYNFGFDLHGVITKHPEAFSVLTNVLVSAGHKVSIITGCANDGVLEEVLAQSGIAYTHIFSITSSLIEKDYTPRFDWDGRPIFPDGVWDRAKADYCAEKNIIMHFDDSDVYGNFFTTPYIKIDSNR